MFVVQGEDDFSASVELEPEVREAWKRRAQVGGAYRSFPVPVFARCFLELGDCRLVRHKSLYIRSKDVLTKRRIVRKSNYNSSNEAEMTFAFPLVRLSTKKGA